MLMHCIFMGLLGLTQNFFIYVEQKIRFTFHSFYVLNLRLYVMLVYGRSFCAFSGQLLFIRFPGDQSVHTFLFSCSKERFGCHIKTRFSHCDQRVDNKNDEDEMVAGYLWYEYEIKRWKDSPDELGWLWTFKIFSFRFRS